MGNGSVVYWYEEPKKVNTVLNHLCSKCNKDTVTFLDSKPVWKANPVNIVAPATFIPRDSHYFSHGIVKHRILHSLFSGQHVL
jgi:hypothetical protein